MNLTFVYQFKAEIILEIKVQVFFNFRWFTMTSSSNSLNQMTNDQVRSRLLEHFPADQIGPVNGKQLSNYHLKITIYLHII